MKEKSLAKNAILNTIRTLMSMIFPLITYPYVTRILQVENLGKVNFSASIVNYFILLAGLGISTYAVREGARLRQDTNKLESFAGEIFTINVMSMLFSYAVFICCVAGIRSLHAYIPLIFIQSIGIIGPTIGVEWVYTIYEDYSYITIRTIIVQVVSMILLFCFVHKRSDYVIYAFILVFSSTAMYIFNYVHSKKYIKIRIVRTPHIKEHIRPIIVIFAMSVATTIYVNSDTTMLGVMSGDYYVGLYNVATKVYTIIKSLMAACILVSLPRLSNYIALQKIEEFNLKASEILNAFTALLLPTVIGMFMTAKDIIQILAGETYLEATIALKILSISLLFSILAVYFTNVILLPTKKEKQIMYATFASAIVNLLLNIVCISRWNQVGAAITTAIAEAVVMIWQIVVYMRAESKIGIQIEVKNILASLVGCGCIAIICAIISGINIPFYIGFICKIGLSVLSYIAVLIAFRHTLFMNGLKIIYKKRFHRRQNG